jgi:hypothetical protein
MSTVGDDSPKVEKPEGDSPVSVHGSKKESSPIHAPSIPGHQEVIDAIWPTIMKDVESTL